MIAAIAAYIHSLPKPSVRNDTFDIAFSLFARKKEFRDENVKTEVPSSENWKSKDHTNIYTSANFLTDVLKNNPANSPFYTEVLPKGIRSNSFCITGITKWSCLTLQLTIMGHTLKRETNTNKLYCEVGENVHTVHMDDNQYFYNICNCNRYTKSYVSINDVIMLKRSYCLPFSRIIRFPSGRP